MAIKQPYNVKKYFSISLYRDDAERVTAHLKAQGKDFESYVKDLVLKDIMHSNQKKKQN